MVVTRGDRDKSFIYTILSPPDETWLKVLRAYPGSEPRKHKIGLDDHGCQPYENDNWNQSNWLREVK